MEDVLATGDRPAPLEQHRDTVCEAAPAKGASGGIQCSGKHVVRSVRGLAVSH